LDLTKTRRTLAPRAARVITICRAVAWVIVVASVIATWRLNAFYPLMIALLVGPMWSNRILLTWVPVSFPGFDDQVEGLLLGGMSEGAAVAQVSRGMAFGAIFRVCWSACACAAIVSAAYGHDIPYSAISAFFAHTALWITGGAALAVVGMFVLLVWAASKRSDGG
jgi:hypothetical protein